MKDCLFTKLLRIVDNDDLVTQDTLRLFVEADSGYDGSEAYFRLIAGEETTITVVGDGYISAGSGGQQVKQLTHGINDYTNIFYTNGTYYIDIVSKYPITLLDLHNIVYVKASDLSYCTNISWLAGKIKGDTSSLEKLPLQNFFPSNLLGGDFAGLMTPSRLVSIASYNTNMYGNIEDIANNSLQEVTFTYNTLVVGDISSFAICPSITYITLPGTAVEGSIESLASALAPSRAAGSTLTIVCSDYITYNGSIVGNEVRKVISFNGHGGYTVS